MLHEIKQRLLQNAYKNEVHIRVQVVCRVLEHIGWNIWNPQEVYLEYPTDPLQNSKRVDVSLLHGNSQPIIYIEVKQPGMVDQNLSDIERQLSEYNRNNNAMFGDNQPVLIQKGRKLLDACGLRNVKLEILLEDGTVKTG
jgi:hypothetical protein